MIIWFCLPRTGLDRAVYNILQNINVFIFCQGLLYTWAPPWKTGSVSYNEKRDSETCPVISKENRCETGWKLKEDVLTSYAYTSVWRIRCSLSMRTERRLYWPLVLTTWHPISLHQHRRLVAFPHWYEKGRMWEGNQERIRSSIVILTFCKFSGEKKKRKKKKHKDGWRLEWGRVNLYLKRFVFSLSSQISLFLLLDRHMASYKFGKWKYVLKIFLLHLMYLNSWYLICRHEMHVKASVVSVLCAASENN